MARANTVEPYNVRCSYSVKQSVSEVRTIEQMSWACFWTLIMSVPNECAVGDCPGRPDQQHKNARLPSCSVVLGTNGGMEWLWIGVFCWLGKGEALWIVLDNQCTKVAAYKQMYAVFRWLVWHSSYVVGHVNKVIINLIIIKRICKAP